MRIVECEAGHLVGVGADVDDLRTHPGKQQIGQCEGPEEVGAQRRLESVHRLRPVLGDRAGVVDEDVDVTVDQSGERAHRGLVGQVESDHRGVATHLRGTPRAEFDIADRQDHLRAVIAHRLRQHGLHGGLGADRGEAGSADLAVRGADDACSGQRALQSSLDLESEIPAVTRGQPLVRHAVIQSAVLSPPSR